MHPAGIETSMRQTIVNCIDSERQRLRGPVALNLNTRAQLG